MTHHEAAPGASSPTGTAVSGGRAPCIALLSRTIDLHYLAPAFEAECPGVDLRLGDDLGALADIDAAVCWYPPEGLLAQLPRLRLVQSVGAGVDHILADRERPAGVPVCRILDDDMVAGMVAYVAWAVTRQQRHMAAYEASAAAGRWEEQPIVSPRRHRVGIAGLGRLGVACAAALAGIGYVLRGWSRRPKSGLPAGMEAFHGAGGLAPFLAGCDTLVCLLPLTDQTRGFLDARLFEHLPRGAHVINVGRGGHLVEAGLLAALATGQVGGATLDAFDEEPLPADHPFWRTPGVLVTPHIATRTDTRVIARQTLANLAMLAAGGRPRGQIDPAVGY